MSLLLRVVLWSFLLLWPFVGAVRPGQAAELFPSAHELFPALRADPRELQYALRLFAPVGKQLFGEAALGDYFGLARWRPADDVQLQVNLGGGAWGLFDLESRTNDMQVADYSANVPLDFRMGKWSGRLMLFHLSSHLGDDYLAKTGGVTEKHTYDMIRLTTAFEPSTLIRFYGGYGYSLRALPSGYGKSELQGGLELFTPWFGGNHWQAYWAADLQSWERVDWNPVVHTQVGLTLARDSATKQTISVFGEFASGHRSYGQFFLQKETSWSGGIRFNFS